MTEQSIKGRLFLSGALRFKTPLLIGDRQGDEQIDITICKNRAGKPYLPGSSLAGVLRHWYFNHIRPGFSDNHEKLQKLDDFWGESDKNNPTVSPQSIILVSDAPILETKLVRIRDGVSISQSTGIALDQKKYDYEILEPGGYANICVEMLVRDPSDWDACKGLLISLGQALAKGGIRLGAMTQKGFGECWLDNPALHILDYNKPQDVLDWLTGEWRGKNGVNVQEVQGFIPKKTELIIDAWFSLKTSLLVRSYSGSPGAPDAVHLSYQGSDASEPVLPGTSVKGALRGRALRILNTLDVPEALKALNSFMGEVDEDKKIKRRSRLRINEAVVENSSAYIQNRIRIDRFTAGVMHGALFTEAPCWPGGGGKEEKMVHVVMTLDDPKDWEAGLMLLLLKDLWLSDLPVGGGKGIGRGMLQGVAALIDWNGKQLIFNAKANDELLVQEAEGAVGFIEELETCVAAIGSCGQGGKS